MDYQFLACTNLLPTKALVQCNIDIETLHPHLPWFSAVDMGDLQSCTAW